MGKHMYYGTQTKQIVSEYTNFRNIPIALIGRTWILMSYKPKKRKEKPIQAAKLQAVLNDVQNPKESKAVIPNKCRSPLGWHSSTKVWASGALWSGPACCCTRKMGHRWPWEYGPDPLLLQGNCTSRESEKHCYKYFYLSEQEGVGNLFVLWKHS